jgi:hypothetical protein
VVHPPLLRRMAKWLVVTSTGKLYDGPRRTLTLSAKASTIHARAILILCEYIVVVGDRDVVRLDIL